MVQALVQQQVLAMIMDGDSDADNNSDNGMVVMATVGLLV